MKIDEIHAEIAEAENRIRPYILTTPLIESHYLSNIINGKVYLKCENDQYTGSFKARGSLNKVLATPVSLRKKGFVAASTGNHGLGVGRAVQIANAPGQVFLPKSASQAKIKDLSHYPIELKYVDGDPLATEVFAKRMAEQTGRIWLSPYNDKHVIAGQGSIGLELKKQVDKIDFLLATVGGGGLISGIGSFLKTEGSDIQIVGCQPENSPEMTMSLEKGEIIRSFPSKETLSDGSAGGIEEGAITFPLCSKIIDSCILVSESEIRDAIRVVFFHHRKVIEGSAAVAVASLIKEKEVFKGAHVVIVLCGGNIDTSKFLSIVYNP